MASLCIICERWGFKPGGGNFPPGTPAEKFVDGLIIDLRIPKFTQQQSDLRSQLTASAPTPASFDRGVARPPTTAYQGLPPETRQSSYGSQLQPPPVLTPGSFGPLTSHPPGPSSMQSYQQPVPSSMPGSDYSAPRPPPNAPNQPSGPRVSAMPRDFPSQPTNHGPSGPTPGTSSHPEASKEKATGPANTRDQGIAGEIISKIKEFKMDHDKKGKAKHHVEALKHQQESLNAQANTLAMEKEKLAEREEAFREGQEGEAEKREEEREEEEDDEEDDEGEESSDSDEEDSDDDDSNGDGK